jgi:hypothetical protein
MASKRALKKGRFSGTPGARTKLTRAQMKIVEEQYDAMVAHLSMRFGISDLSMSMRIRSAAKNFENRKRVKIVDLGGMNVVKKSVAA